MAISADFTVNGSLLGPGSNRVFLVAGGSTVALQLVDTSGAVSPEWTFIGASETTTYPTIATTGRGKASFTAPAAPGHGFGLTTVLQCQNGGSTYTVLICVGTTTQIAAGESTERGDIGWAAQLNENTRSTSGGETVSVYQTAALARAATPPADGGLIRVIEPPGEFRYSATSGAGWADDGNTIIKPDGILVGANGRYFSTRSGATCATFDALRGLYSGNQDHVHLQSHTAFGDGGGGIFDRRPLQEGDADDNGTLAIAGEWVYQRRDATRNTPINVAWYGIVGDGVTRWHEEIQAILDSMNNGEALYFPRGRYLIGEPLRFIKYGILVKGEGKEVTIPGKGTTIQVDFTGIASGSLATISSVTPHDVDKDQLAVVVTLTGLTGLSGVSPGDSIKISNATLERNNGVFTIMSVDAGTGSVTYYGYNLFVHLVSWDWRPAISGETNNGSLHWEIRKNAIQCYTRDIEFCDIHFFGNNTCSAIIDGAFPGAGGVPDLENAHTALKFFRCRIAQSWIGVKCGDFSGYAAGGCTSVTWPGNNDMYVFSESVISDVSNYAFLAINPTGNSMLHSFNNCDITRGYIGIAVRRGSVTTRNVNFSAFTGTCYAFSEVAQVNQVFGGGAESCARAFVVGFAGYLAASNNGIYLSVDGFRCQPGEYLPADKCVIQIGNASFVSFRNCQFIQNDDQTIGVYSYRDSYNTRAPQLLIENCGFPISDPAKIVTCMTGAAGPYPTWWHSRNNIVIPFGTNTFYQVDDGLHAGYGNPVGTGIPFAELKAGFHNKSTTPVTLSTNSSTVILANVFHGLKASSSYHCTLGFRCVLEVDADASICGAIDEVVDLYISTNSSRVATVTILGTQYADVSRLPSGLSGATATLATSAGGVTVYATRPTDVTCLCKAKVWVEEFEEIGL